MAANGGGGAAMGHGGCLLLFSRFIMERVAKSPPGLLPKSPKQGEDQTKEGSPPLGPDGKAAPGSFPGGAGRPTSAIWQGHGPASSVKRLQASGQLLTAFSPNDSVAASPKTEPRGRLCPRVRWEGGDPRSSPPLSVPRPAGSSLPNPGAGYAVENHVGNGEAGVGEGGRASARGAEPPPFGHFGTRAERNPPTPPPTPPRVAGGGSVTTMLFRRGPSFPVPGGFPGNPNATPNEAAEKEKKKNNKKNKKKKRKRSVSR